MKKRRHRRSSNSTSNSNRLPPSVPKCVRKCSKPEGYITDYVQKNDVMMMFLFKKTSDGYAIHRKTASSTEWVHMHSDINTAPAVRNMLRDQPTLTKAIAAVESYLEAKLPDVR